jgi:hypothetical protein
MDDDVLGGGGLDERPQPADRPGARQHHADDAAR